MSKKDKMENLVVGGGLFLFGVLMIILGIVINDKIWFTATFIIIGTICSLRAYEYLIKNFNKKRGH